jgi:hypothetical protein
MTPVVLIVKPAGSAPSTMDHWTGAMPLEESWKA